MAHIKVAKLPSRTMSATSTADAWVPVTPWTRAAGLANARANGEMRGRIGNFIAVPGFQLCNDERSPDSPVAIPFLGGQGGYANADGTFDVAATLASLSTVDKKQIRFGWLVKLTAAGAGSGTMSGEIELYY